MIPELVNFSSLGGNDLLQEYQRSCELTRAYQICIYSLKIQFMLIKVVFLF